MDVFKEVNLRNSEINILKEYDASWRRTFFLRLAFLFAYLKTFLLSICAQSVCVYAYCRERGVSLAQASSSAVRRMCLELENKAILTTHLLRVCIRTCKHMLQIRRVEIRLSVPDLLSVLTNADAQGAAAFVKFKALCWMVRKLRCHDRTLPSQKQVLYILKG